MSQEEAAELSEVMKVLSAEFDKLCQERHEAGAKEYGTFTFLGNDIVRMMAEELADTTNYCRMQFIKIMILNQAFLEDPRLINAADGGDEITIGIGAFKGAGENGWQR